jgi:hypothetical protein
MPSKTYRPAVHLRINQKRKFVKTGMCFMPTRTFCEGSIATAECSGLESVFSNVPDALMAFRLGANRHAVSERG